MKDIIESLIQQAIVVLQEEEKLPDPLEFRIVITRTKDPKYGDFACNIALMIAKEAKQNPREVAEKIIRVLLPHENIYKVEIAGPGFINFFVTQASLNYVVKKILTQGEKFGHCDIGEGQRVHIEYVSANPTGPLHVGHGRGAAYGSCVANLLKAANFNVQRNYYVNDYGRQMRILAVSIWLRYMQQHNEVILLPSNAYQGAYISDIASDITAKYGDRFVKSQVEVTKQMVAAGAQQLKEEAYIDALINVATQLLGSDDFEIIRQTGIKAILDDIRDDLEEFGVVYDEWFHESTLFQQGLLEEGIKLLDKHGYIYEKNGATWFQATKLGDDKDRVLVRDSGQPTYFASDVAYHLYKYNQGYDKIIDVFGSDHHGYVPRIRAFLKGLGKDPHKLKVLLVQFAVLYRGAEKVSMSTRKGQFVTLRELRDEVGNDAARYFYVMRRPEQHLDFDLELAKSQSNENPVYYIQYAHARVCSVMHQLEQSQYDFDQTKGLDSLDQLETSHENQLLILLTRYPELIAMAASKYEPHLLAHYLYELANGFHTYYNASKFIVEDDALRNARLCLVLATRQVIKNGLGLLGLNAPEKM